MGVSGFFFGGIFFHGNCSHFLVVPCEFTLCALLDPHTVTGVCLVLASHYGNGREGWKRGSLSGVPYDL